MANASRSEAAFNAAPRQFTAAFNDHQMGSRYPDDGARTMWERRRYLGRERCLYRLTSLHAVDPQGGTEFRS
jgi:hypothetical protein